MVERSSSARSLLAGLGLAAALVCLPACGGEDEAAAGGGAQPAPAGNAGGGNAGGGNPTAMAAPVPGQPPGGSAKPNQNAWVFEPDALPSQDTFDQRAAASIDASNWREALDTLQAEVEADLGGG